MTVPLAISPEWVAAIFGIVGTVVGATVAGLVNLALEVRREGAAARQAKLVVADELHTGWSQLSLLAEEKRTPDALSPEAAARFLPTATWDRFRETLALKGALSEGDWLTLSTFFYNVASTRVLVLDRAPQTALGPAEVKRNTEMAAIAATLYTDLTGRDPETGSQA